MSTMLCPTCGRVTRPSGTLAKDHPGTLHRARRDGTCGSCWDRESRTGGGIAPRPSDYHGRPTVSLFAELCRWTGAGFELVQGRVVGLTRDEYTLDIDGEAVRFGRDEWMEVLAS